MTPNPGTKWLLGSSIGVEFSATLQKTLGIVQHCRYANTISGERDKTT